MTRRVVVTGIGVVSPLGRDLASTWQALLEGQSGVGPITLFDANGFSCRIAAEVRGFSDEAVADEERRLLKWLNRAARFGLAATRMAMADAGLAAGAYDPQRLGIAVGCSGSRPSAQALGDLCRSSSAGRACRTEQSPVDFLRRSFAASAAVLANLYDAQGPTLAAGTACAASAQALGAAFRTIQRDEADVMIAGGYDSMISESELLGFGLLRALSTRNEEPQWASRPFDRDRDGFVLGEGAAILILEERAHALARRARVRAELLGYGTTMSTASMTDSPADGSGAFEAMTAALADANLAPTDVSYINAHGTSTRQNDRSETAAIRRAFGEHAYRIPVSSTKSMTGHLVSAAGAIELAFCVCALQDQVVPPTINYEKPDPDCDLDYVPNRSRAWPLRSALSNSLALGGVNASLIVAEHR